MSGKKKRNISIVLIIFLIMLNFTSFNCAQSVKAETKEELNQLTQLNYTTDAAVKITPISMTTTTDASVKTLDIVEITDFHGQLKDSKDQYEVGAALAKEVKKIKDSNPDTLVIGGGDLYQGTPVSNVLKGVPVQQVMSNIGMEVTTLGNHEFDWGLDTIDNVTMKDANYSIVCSNLYKKDKDGNAESKPKYDPYKIIDKNGVKIAVIGAILKDVATIVLPANIKDYIVTDPATEINKYADEIKKDKSADVIIAVVHDGTASLNNIVSNLDGNVDAVFGGHSHSVYDGVVQDTTGKSIPVLNACNAGKGYIDLKVTLNSDNTISGFSSKGSNWNSVAVNGTTPIDADAGKIIDDAYDQIGDTFNEVIGNDIVSYSSTQKDSPFGESELGNWMADVVKNKAKADVGIVNNGGIRLSPVAAGDITVGTIFKLMPFDNTVTTVSMTGSQLKALIEQGIADTTGKGLQISGIKITYDSSKQSYVQAVKDSNGNIVTPEVSGQRVQSIVKEDTGAAIKDTDILKVAAPDFLGTGGDGFTEFIVPEIKDTYVDSHILVRDALLEDVRNNNKITVNLNNRLVNKSSASTGTPTVMTIGDAKKAQIGYVTLTGYVNVVSGTTVFMQDDPTSPTAGLALYNNCNAALKKGDKITVTGTLSVYKGLIEIKPDSSSTVTIVGTGNTIIPKEVSIKDINDDLQGILIKIKNVTFTSIDNNASSNIKDSTGTIAIYKMPAVSNLNINNTADVIAAVSKFNINQLAVNSAEDVVKTSGNSSGATISIVATSDIHGNILNWDYSKNAAPSKGQGLAKVSTYVNRVRAANPNVMLVDDGDTIQGTPLSYYYDMVDKTTTYPLSVAMGAMKYDTVTLGNHEFNYGLDTLNRFIKDQKAQGIHVLSGNIYNSDNTNFVDPYYIKEFNINGKTVKVGILGLTTKCIPNWEDPEHYKGLHFNDLVDEANKYVPIMKKEGADIIIVAAHSGEEGAADVIPENQIKAIATKVSGIDAIIAGHSHSLINDTTLKNPEGKLVPVVEPSKWGTYVSQIDISLDDDNKVSNIATKNVAMDNSIAEDSNIVSLIEPYQSATLAYTSTILGQSEGEYSGANQTTAPSAIMDLINKVQMQSAGTQLSIAAPLSASAYIPKGDISIKDIMGVYVYENYLYGVKMSGAQIKKWLEYSVRYYKQVANSTDPIVKDAALNIPDYNLDQLYGASYDIDLTKPVGSRIVNLKYNGKLINDNDVFTVAINDYRYNGGGGFMTAAGISNTDPSLVTYSSAKKLGDDGQVRSLMTSYIKSQGSITPDCANNWKLYTTSISSSKHHKKTSTTTNTIQTNNEPSINKVQDSAKNNWVFQNNSWYYRDENGNNISNAWDKINNVWYYFNSDGKMKTGWLKYTDGNWYYLQSNGAMKIGWLLDSNGKWYYLQTNGAMKIGWLLDNNRKWYYLKDDGSMAVNEVAQGYNIDSNGQWVA